MLLVNEDGEVLRMVDLVLENECETNAGNAVHNRVQIVLQYQIIDIRSLHEKAKLSAAMLHIICINI